MYTHLKLLPKADLIRTGPVDEAEWNYRPVLGWISRQRIRLVASLLPKPVGRLLKIGYGSGVSLPHFAKFAGELHGIDPHPHPREVEAKLAKHGVKAFLRSGTAEAMPYETGFFDSVAAISAMEFIPDLDAACREIRRVLKPGGSFVFVTPGRSPLVDFGLKLMTGRSAKDDFAERRERIVPTLREHFDFGAENAFPIWPKRAINLYTAYRLTPHPIAASDYAASLASERSACLTSSN